MSRLLGSALSGVKAESIGGKVIPARAGAQSREKDTISGGPSRKGKGKGKGRFNPYDDGGKGSWTGGKGARKGSADDRWGHDKFQGGTEVIGSEVFVRNLPKEVTSAQLHGLFARTGFRVTEIKIDRGPITTATVGFQRRDAAPMMAERCHGHIMGGAPIKVSVVENTATRCDLDDDEPWKNFRRRAGGTSDGAKDAGLLLTPSDRHVGFKATSRRVSIFDRMT
mmetsp:Transcript_11344/g.25202  ORF Transcript_11344/g.25202 Transcript_11344/m.25202 type:complete len:224 (+) Transcript_11344:76-747(+)